MIRNLYPPAGAMHKLTGEMGSPFKNIHGLDFGTINANLVIAVIKLIKDLTGAAGKT